MKKLFSGNRIVSFILILLALMVCSSVWAEENCFSQITYVKPKDVRANRALFILIDETMPFSKSMKEKVMSLLSGWGNEGDQVKIARFSASYRGLYPELIYSKKIDSMPDDNFMFNLHYADKRRVLSCMAKQKADFKTGFAKVLGKELEKFNPKIPKSEIFRSLRLLSQQIVGPDDAKEKTLLLISDGLENSKELSFYSSKVVKNLNPRKVTADLRRQGLLGFWKNTNIYMYGLGLMPDKKHYSDPENILKLKRFWERYFVESGAKVKEIGVPELLITSIN